MAFVETESPSDGSLIPSQDDRLLACITHLLTFVSSFIAPVVIYLLKKDESPFVAAHAKAALNFQLSLLVYALISYVLVLLLVGILLLVALGIFATIFTVVAAVKAYNGELYTYPMSIQFMR